MLLIDIEWLRLFAAPFDQELIQQNAENQDQAERTDLPDRMDAAEIKPIVDHGDNRNTEEGAGNFAFAARDIDAAQHRNRNRLQFRAQTGVGAGGGDAGGFDDRGDARQRAGRDIDPQPDIFHADRGKMRGAFIGADGIEIPPEHGFAQ